MKRECRLVRFLLTAFLWAQVYSERDTFGYEAGLKSLTSAHAAMNIPSTQKGAISPKKIITIIKGNRFVCGDRAAGLHDII